MKKLHILLVSVLLTILLFAVTGCGKTEINPADYLTLEFTGYNGYGHYSGKTFDAEKMRDDYEKKLGDVTKSKLTSLFGDGIRINYGNDGSYSNGDTVDIEWNVDEDKLAEFEKEYKVSMKLEDFEYTVSGLEPVETFDPFTDVTVTAEGISGQGKASINTSSDYVLYFLTDSGEARTGLNNVSNGDTVTVFLYARSNATDEYYLNEYGKVPTSTTKKFTISGLDEYVEKLSDISSSLTDTFKAEVEAKIKESAESWNIPDSLCEITYMGDALRSSKNSSYYYSTQNTYILLYKVDVDSPRDGAFSYYFTGSVNNLLKTASGEYTYDELTVPTVSTGWWVSGTYFEHNDLYYAGYESFDTMHDALLAEDDNYSSEENFDKTIIDKQTHTPKDFTAIDDTVTLEAADVCTLKVSGYNTIVGFTQTGYDKITAFDGTKLIKLVLPSKDADGQDIDDVHFYNNAVDTDKGYNLNTLLATTSCPRLHLVLPDTCLRFNGFYNADIDSTVYYKIYGCDLNEGLQTLGNYAFYHMQGLKEISIPASVGTISYRCFGDCKNLEKVTFLGKITAFKEYCFSDCNNLVIDELVLDSQTIEGLAFNGVTINRVVLSSDTYHSDYNWSRNEWDGCNVLALEISSGVTLLRQYIFEGMNTIKEVVIPDTVTEIKEAAFKNCSALEKVTFPSKLPVIGQYAFANCSALVIDSISLDADTSIGSYAFDGVTVNTVTLTSDNYVASDSYGWSKASLGGCIVKNFVIADTVTTIPSYLFNGIKYAYNKIELPANVTTLSKYAFYGFDDLIKLVCTASVTNIDNNLGFGSNITVYAPKGSAMITYCTNKNIKCEETE